VNVIGVSVDSQFSHFAWVDKGGIGRINFPLVADLTKNIARDYDVLLNDAVALRGSFLIDDKGIVRHAVINDLPLGRNVDEMLRMIAGWQKGDEGMKADAKGVAEYLAKHESEL